VTRRVVLDPLRAVVYLRVSTDRQELGPEAQRAACEAWARSRGVELVSEHRDEASGASALEARPGLVGALGALVTLGAGVLLVARRDRLARDVAVALAIDRAVRQVGGRVASADGVAEGEGPTDELLRTLLDAFAQYERALIVLRTRGALKALRARGQRAGSVPWGYVLEDDRKTLRPDATERAVLELVRVRRKAGASMGEIVAELYERGVRGRTGKPLGLTQVARLARAR
jgi:DNA invertase Pin-like site-specific DNA recombinase